MNRAWIALVLCACSREPATPAPTPVATHVPAAHVASDGGSAEPLATEPQCRRLLDHLVDLEFAKAGGHGPDVDKQKQNVKDAKRDEFLSACAKMPASRLECALAGSDIDAVARCDAK